jgi:septum formation protein
MSDKPTLILASGSPQRCQLLTAAGYQFDVIIPHESAECGICSTTGPAGLVAELALRKGANVVEQILAAEQEKTDPGRLIIACDTVAECGGEILGKPVDEEHAQQMLLRLRGNNHRVYSGLCVLHLNTQRLNTQRLNTQRLNTQRPNTQRPNTQRTGARAAPDDSHSATESRPEIRVDTTHLRMECISDRQLEEYLASGQWQGKAGALGYQDCPGWLQITKGSESNVIGLPMELLAEMLSRHGL